MHRERRHTQHSVLIPGRRRRPTFIAAHRVVIAVFIIAAIIIGMFWQVHALKSAIPIPTNCHYRADGALPDPHCTPGAVAKGYGKAQLCQYHDPPRPPLSYTEPLKRRLVRSYGSVYGATLRGYELDHLIPLELGGDPTSVKNLWPEPHPSSFSKDHIENKLHRLVCSGQMTLRHAQSLIRHDWRQG